MADKRKDKDVSPEMLINLAENAKAVNLYAGMGAVGQQMLLENLELSEHKLTEKSAQ